MNMHRINATDRDKQLDPEQIERLIRAIERFTKLFDAWCDADLNARYPYGKPVDRWRRGA
jgi:hypothetical protein